jgi:hypothetical protein
MRCAVEIQDHLASGDSPLRLRVALNLGDVIVGQDGDLYGDGITIAVRLEGITDPGGILISEKVYSEVEGKVDVGFEDRGEQQLKNIAKPVRVYAVRTGPHSAPINKLGVAFSGGKLKVGVVPPASSLAFPLNSHRACARLYNTGSYGPLCSERSRRNAETGSGRRKRRRCAGRSSAEEMPRVGASVH